MNWTPILFSLLGICIGSFGTALAIALILKPHREEDDEKK